MENNLKALPMLSFGKAVSICLNKKYTTFKGRARRSEYWYFVLFQSIVLVIATILDNFVGLTFEYSFYGWLYLLCGLALLLPALGVGFRRLHDVGHSGWWILISLIPFVGAIVLLVFWCSDSQMGPNKYGESPKYVTDDTEITQTI